MKLVEISHPVLLKKADPVKTVDARVRKIISAMKRVLRESDIGIGLAAPQVGIPLRIFLVSPNLPETDDKEREPIDVYINPTILHQEAPKHSKGKRTLEGCLSIPEIWGPVARSRNVTLQYTDEKGKKHTKKFNGYIATIIQHELDHLDGLLFTHRVLEQGDKLYKTVDDELEPVNL